MADVCRDKEESIVSRKYEFWSYHYPVIMKKIRARGILVVLGEAARLGW